MSTRGFSPRPRGPRRLPQFLVTLVALPALLFTTSGGATTAARARMGMSPWFTSGNGNTNPSANFLGTTNAQPLVIRTNNVEVLRVTAGGSVGIGTSNPIAKLTVNGSISATGGTFATPLNASIIGNAGTVTNGVYTTGSYADPSWLTSLAGSKITGAVADATHAASADSATTATNFTGNLGGDVTGTQGTTTVSALRGVPLSSTAPSEGQVLTFHSGSWVAAAAAAGSSTAPPVLCPGCFLQNANLSGANLAEAYFGPDRAANGADLDHVNLSGATLTGATLGSALLRNANLSGATLTGANLIGANLSSDDLSGANLSGANLELTDLNGVDLTNANLTSTDLRGSFGGTSATITGVIWSNTLCPDLTNSNNDGNTCAGHGF